MAAKFKTRNTAPVSQGGEWEDLGQQPMVAAPPAPQAATPPSLPGRMWKAANTPVLDLALGDGATKGIMSPGSESGSFDTDRQNEDVSRLTAIAHGEPDPGGLRSLFFGIGDSAQDAVSSFTTPIALATAAAGKVVSSGRAAATAGRALGPVTKAVLPAARAVETVAAPAFAVQGGKEVLTSHPNIGYDSENGITANPEEVQKMLLGGAMAAGGAGGTAASVDAIGSRARGSLRSRAVPDSGGLTTGDVYDALRDKGVDVSLGQAGQGKLARWAEDFAENTPGGAGKMARFREKQTSQFGNALRDTGNQLDPTGNAQDIADQAAQFQRALETAKDVAHTNASDNFKNNLSPLFNYSTADTADIAQAARDLKARLQTGEIKSLHPELTGLLDEIDSGYGDAHNNKSMFDSVFRDRSRLMKSRFSDATVPGENEAAAKQMAGVMKDSLSKAANKAGKGAEFDTAMTDWKDYHDTWGDRTSPLVRALENKEPGKVLDQFISSNGTGSVRAIRMLKKAAPDFLSMIKREVVRRIADPKATGVREGYGNMNAQLNNYNKSFLKELFTPDELKTVRAMAVGGKTLGFDVNPPGSGRYVGTLASLGLMAKGGMEAAKGMFTNDPASVATGTAEAVGMPAASAATSAFNTNPSVVDFFMGRNRGGTQAAAPAATGTGTQAAAPAGARTIPNPFGGQRGTGLANPARRANNSQTGAVKPAALGGDWIVNLIDKYVGEGKPNPSALRRITSDIKKTDEALQKPSSASAAIAKAHNANLNKGQGGVTYHLARGNMEGKDAFAVSVFPELEKVVDGESLSKSAVAEFLADPKRQEILRNNPDVSVGTWTNKGKTVIDLVATPSNLGESKRLGKKFNQESIFDLLHNREIPSVGGKMPDQNLLKVAQSYRDGSTTHSESFPKDERGADIADAYDAMEHSPDDPEVKASYEALIKETKAQWGHLKKNGFTMSTSPGDVYANADEMLKDIRDNKHITVFEGGQPPADHPLSEIDPETGQNHNTTFRAVHDIMGHGIGGHDFTEEGEENAFHKHSKMYSAEAIPALTTETKGQASWFFNNKAVREGGELGKFPEQKAALLPEEFYKREGTPVEDRMKDIKKPDSLDAIHYSDAELSELDPKFHGKNMIDEKNGQALNRPDSIRKKSFPDAWSDETYLGKRSETFRGKGDRFLTRANRYEANLNASRYYDLPNDPDGIKAQVKQELLDKNKEKFGVNMPPSEPEIEAQTIKRLREMGYSGRLDTNDLIASWDKVPVTKGIIPDHIDRVLTYREREAVTFRGKTEDFVATVNSLPEIKQWVDTAKAGEVGRKWYERGNKAFDALVQQAPDYFGEEGDRNRLGAVVAATSPQQGVNMNLREALRVWKAWVDDGRPVEESKLDDIISENTYMTATKRDNIKLALQNKEMWPELVGGRYFKVPSFADNLKGLMNSVTNDSWMGIFSGLTDRLDNPQRYHAITTMTRLAAKELGWQPAEAQAAIWVFTRSLAERAGWSKVNESKFGISNVRDIVGKVDDKFLKQYADDFADIMANDSEVRSTLKRLGVHLDKLDDKLDAIGHTPITAGTKAASPDSIRKLADRIQAERDRGAGKEAVQVSDSEVPDEPDTDFNFGGNETGIRRYTPDDANDLKSWNESVWKSKDENGAAISSPADEENPRYSDAVSSVNFSKAARKIGDTDESYILKRDGKTLGIMKLDTYGHDRGFDVTVDWLASHPGILLGDIAEKGVGRELLQHAIERAAELKVGLQLKSSGSATGFYEHAGMKRKTSLAENQYYLDPQQVQDMANKKRK